MAALRPLRLWPGIAGAAVIVVGAAIVPLVMPAAAMGGVLAAMVAALIVILWWLFMSRAPWPDRVAGVLLIAVSIFAMRPLLDRSIATGAMGFLPVLSLPLFAFALVAWALVTRTQPAGIRRALLVGFMAAAVGVCMLARTAGVVGGGGFQLRWRWTPTPEERLLAQGNDDPIPPAAAPAPETTPVASAPGTIPPAGAVKTETGALKPESGGLKPVGYELSRPADWPGFRGPNRDGTVHNLRIATDWTTSPPVQLWHRAIGPGWSSFAVDRGLLYTQEQRGDDEIVACYRVSNGEPVWRHRDHVRFWESNGGAGPRGTPTVVGGRVYALGATGIFNVLDAGTGAVIWSRNAAADTKTKIPMWGFSSSPLVIDDLVVVATSGNLVAYELGNGTPRWHGPAHRGSYSSPQLATLDGARQVLLQTADGVTSVDPETGTTLWEHAWGEGTPIVQPAVTEDGDVLIDSINGMGGNGIRRLAVSHTTGRWAATERWTSTGLKPYFNDFVINKGYAYGFDGSILSCIDLSDGARKWKGGRYGSGQLVLLPDQDVLLVVSEEGDLALVSATPSEFKELAKVPAIDGKTWNHPVIVGDTLLIRNGEVMAALKLTLQR